MHYKRLSFYCSFFIGVLGFLFIISTYAISRNNSIDILKDLVTSKYYFYQSILHQKDLHTSWNKGIILKFIEQDEESTIKNNFILLDHNFKPIYPSSWEPDDFIETLIQKYKTSNKSRLEEAPIVYKTGFNVFAGIFRLNIKHEEEYILVSSTLVSNTIIIFLIVTTFVIVIFSLVVYSIMKLNFSKLTSITQALVHSMTLFTTRKVVNLISYDKQDDVTTLITAYNNLISNASLIDKVTTVDKPMSQTSTLNKKYSLLPKLKNFELIIYPKNIAQDFKTIILIKEHNHLFYLVIIILQIPNISTAKHQEIVVWHQKLSMDFEDAVVNNATPLYVASLVNKYLSELSYFSPNLFYFCVDDSTEIAYHFKTDYFLSFKKSLFNHEEDITFIPDTHISLPLSIEKLDEMPFHPGDICFCLKEDLMKIVNIHELKQDIQQFVPQAINTKTYVTSVMKLIHNHVGSYKKNISNFLDFLVVIRYKN